MTVETYTRIFAVLVLAGWAAFTLPSLVSGRWWNGEQKVPWSQLPEARRTETVRIGGSILIFGLGGLFLPFFQAGAVVPLAALFPGVVTALWWGRIDFGNNHILRTEHPAPYWTMVLIGSLVSATSLWLLLWAPAPLTIP